MFSYNKKNLDPRVKEYLDKKIIATFKLKKIGKTTEYKYYRYGSMNTCYGLLSKVQKVFYPDFNPYGSGKTVYTRSSVRAGSSRKDGERVDLEIALWTEQGGGAAKKNWHPLTKQLISTLNTQGHVPQAAQVPIIFLNWERPFGRATCADLITKDAGGQLCMWEVKTGTPVNQRAKNVFFKHVKDAHGKDIPCTTTDMWQFQLHFTEKGLRDGGLPIAMSKIIMACKYKKKKEQKRWETMTEQYPQAQWIRKLDYHE